jgi:hypothetical protein
MTPLDTPQPVPGPDRPAVPDGQAIRSKGCNPRLYVYVPLPFAAAIGLEPGERVQWTLLDRATLQMKRSAASAGPQPGTSAKHPRQKPSRPRKIK